MNITSSEQTQVKHSKLFQLLLASLAVVMTAVLVLALVPKTALAASNSYVIDNYSLFSQSEKSTLEAQAKETSEKYGVGVYLLVVNNIGSKTARSYAIDYYKTNSLGLGTQKSGILFLIAVKSRDYVTITYGDGVNAFTDYQIEKMEDAIVDELSDDNWYKAATVYYEKAEYTLAFRAEHGEPLDSNNAPADPFEIIIMIALAFALAILAAGGRLYHLYSQMKTAVAASEAGDYVDRSSFVLTNQNDRYITSTVVATPKPKKSSGHSHGSSIDSGGFGGSSGGKF